jgi:hypothetical protein
MLFYNALPGEFFLCLLPDFVTDSEEHKGLPINYSAGKI